MKNFIINDNLKIVCEWKKTRNAFKHVAELYRNDRLIDNKKIRYLNRTWESYEFESVLYKMADSKELSKDEKTAMLDKIKNNWREIEEQEQNDKMGFLGAFMKLANITSETLEQKNETKLKMLKATMGEGLIIPNDWDELSEEIKEQRLDKIEKVLSN